jgi:hypothetical protein
LAHADSGSREAADHTRHRGLETRAETFGVQFADEELRNRLGQIAVRVGAAGHADAIEWVDVAALKAERLENAAERGFAGRQFARRRRHGAQRAVVKHEALALAHGVAHVGGRHRHATRNVLEQQHRERLGEFRARHRLGPRLQQRLVHGQRLEQAHGPDHADGSVQQGPQGRFMQVAHHRFLT